LQSFDPNNTNGQLEAHFIHGAVREELMGGDEAVGLA
jgi:hypothetical protein